MRLIHEWELPTGDIYEVWQISKSLFKSRVRRELSTTLCCHGTDSMNCILSYYHDVKRCQREFMSGQGKYAYVYAYWQNYKARMHQLHVNMRSEVKTSSISNHNSTPFSYAGMPSRRSISSCISTHRDQSRSKQKRVRFSIDGSVM